MTIYNYSGSPQMETGWKKEGKGSEGGVAWRRMQVMLTACWAVVS